MSGQDRFQLGRDFHAFLNSETDEIRTPPVGDALRVGPLMHGTNGTFLAGHFGEGLSDSGITAQVFDERFEHGPILLRYPELRQGAFLSCILRTCEAPSVAMPDKQTQFNVAAGGRMRLARQALGLRISDFAADLGITVERLANYEAGRHTPPPDIVVRAKKRHGVTLDYIYDNDPKGLPRGLAEAILKPRPVPDEPPAKKSLPKAARA